MCTRHVAGGEWLTEVLASASHWDAAWPAKGIWRIVDPQQMWTLMSSPKCSSKPLSPKLGWEEEICTKLLSCLGAGREMGTSSDYNLVSTSTRWMVGPIRVWYVSNWNLQICRYHFVCFANSSVGVLGWVVEWFSKLLQSATLVQAWACLIFVIVMVLWSPPLLMKKVCVAKASTRNICDYNEPI